MACLFRWPRSCASRNPLVLVLVVFALAFLDKMENTLINFPGLLKHAYKEKLVATEDWSRTNADGFTFFENVKITSDFDYIDKALVHIKKHYSEILNKCDGTQKSKTKSSAIREKANEFFKKKNWLKALKLYSKSVALAEDRSTELGFAYANRSALLLHRGFYKECIEDIDRALQLDYPLDKKPQLVTRREKAIELLPNQKKKIAFEDIPTLPSTNSVLRGATNAVKLSENDEYGRFVEATKDIQPGDIIAIDNPYVVLVAQDYKTTHCGDCGKLCFNPIACRRCCVEMYCSDQCRNEAYKAYHQYECQVMNFYSKEVFDVFNVPEEERDIAEMNKEQIRQLSLRTTLKGFTNYQRSFLDDEDFYEEIGNLQTHRSKLSKSAIMVLAFNCAKQFHILKKHTNFFSKLQFKDKEDILKYHLLRNRLICCFNLGAIQYRLDEAINGNPHITIGLGLYPTYSMFNHSCVENVGYGYYGKTMVIRAIRTIKKGEQCFINYGHFFQQQPKIIRHIQMQRHYLFACNCEACEKDWPIFGGPDAVKNNPGLESPAYLKLEIIRTVLKGKNPLNEELRKEMFKTCTTAERCINFKRQNVNLILYYHVLSNIMVTRFQANDF